MTVDESEQKTLLKMARNAIGHGLVHAEAPEVVPDDYVAPLRQIACTFVTHADQGWVRATERMIGSSIPRRKVAGFDIDPNDKAEVRGQRGNGRGSRSGGRPGGRSGGQQRSRRSSGGRRASR